MSTPKALQLSIQSKIRTLRSREDAGFCVESPGNSALLEGTLSKLSATSAPTCVCTALQLSLYNY